MLAEDCLEGRIEVQDRAAEAEDGRAALAGGTTAAGVDLDVDLALEAGLVEDREDVLPVTLFHEEVGKLLAVHFDCTGAGLHAHAGDGRLAAAGSPVPALLIGAAEDARGGRGRRRGLFGHGVVRCLERLSASMCCVRSISSIQS